MSAEQPFRRQAITEILSEADYRKRAPSASAARHSHPARESPPGAGRLYDIRKKQYHLVPLAHHDHVSLELTTCTIAYPNVVLLEDDRVLLDANTGYTSTELMKHHVRNYPLVTDSGAVICNLPVKSVRFDSIAYLVASENYSSFLLGELPRLVSYGLSADPSNRVPLIVHGTMKPFHRECLSLAGVDPGCVVNVPADTRIEANKCLHASPTYFHQSCAPAAIDYLRGVAGRVDPGGSSVPRKIYLSRSALGVDHDREIVNERQIEQFLEGHGFVTVHPQHHAVRDQIRLFSEADVIVSPFGATWANAVFRKPGSASCILATKWTPEFARIFRHIGNDVSALTLEARKWRDAENISKSFKFFLKEHDFPLLLQAWQT